VPRLSGTLPLDLDAALFDAGGTVLRLDGAFIRASAARHGDSLSDGKVREVAYVAARFVLRTKGTEALGAETVWPLACVFPKSVRCDSAAFSC